MMTRKMAVFLSLFMLTALALCPPRVLAADKVQLRVAYLPVAGHLPVVVSYERDRLNYKGITVDLQPFKSNTAIEAAIRTGAVDAGIVSPPVAFSLAADNVAIKIIGGSHRGGSILVVKNEKNIADLKNKLIGVWGLDNTENLLIYNLFKGSEVRYGLDVRAIGISLGTAVEDFKRDRINALFMPEPIGSQAVKDAKGVEFTPAKDLTKGQISGVIVVRAEYLRQNKPAVDEWMKSVRDAQIFIESDIAETGGLQTSIMQMKYFGYDVDLMKTVLQEHRGNLSFENVSPTEKELKAQLQVAEKLRIISSLIDIGNLLAIK